MKLVTGVMMHHTGINYILKCINIKNSILNLVIILQILHNFDEMNTVLVIIKDFFHKSNIFTAYTF